MLMSRLPSRLATEPATSGKPLSSPDPDFPRATLLGDQARWIGVPFRPESALLEAHRHHHVTTGTIIFLGRKKATAPRIAHVDGYLVRR